MNDKWTSFIDSLHLESGVKEEFKKGYNVESLVDQERQSLKILIHFDELFRAGDLLAIEELLTEYFEPYKARIQPFYRNFRLEDLDELANYLTMRITAEYPFFSEDALSCDGESGEIRIALPSDFHREVYHKRSIDRFIQDLLQESVPRPEQLRLVTVHTEDVSQRIDGIKTRTRQVIEEHKQAMSAPKALKKPQAMADSFVLYGKSILEEGVPAETIRESLKNMTMVGRIIGLDSRTIAGDKELITFSVISKKAGIACKIFLKKNDARPELKAGDLVKVKGNVELDPYKNAFIMTVNHINRHKAEASVDDAEEKRIELHLHTKMSSLDANIELKALFAKMKELGHDTVALTDHGVVQIYPEAYKLAGANGIKVIYGLEGYLFDDSHERELKGRTNHVIILVRNQSGLKNLYRLVSESHINYFYRRPRIPKSLLREHREGLIIGSACEAGELFRAIVEGAGDEKLLEIAEFYDYLEIQPLSNNEYMIRKGLAESREDLKDFNRRVIDIGRQSGKPVVATGDVHFLEKDDSIYRAILMKSKGYADISQPDLYYRTTSEMLAEFDYLGEDLAYETVVKNPRELAASIEKVEPIPSGLNTPKIEGAEDQVKEITLKRAHDIYGDPLPEIVRARLDRELDSIIGHGFAVLYLIAHMLVKKSNDDGYVVGSRGSVGSSLVATMMGITEVNPLMPHYICPECRHSEFIDDEEIGCGVELPDQACPVCGADYMKDGFTIPFETFLGFKGDKVPDIDLNFSGEYQPVIHKHTETLFGKGNVFKAGTISTVAEKTAAGYVRKYFDEENMEPPGDIEVEALASGCVGVKRTTGQHPGGLVIVPDYVDVLDFTPVQRPADDVKSDITTTHFDYHSIDDCLVKLDLLGHDDPTLIKYLEEMTELKPGDVPLGDEAVMSLFSSPDQLKLEEKFVETGSLGLPEFGTSFVRKMLLETKPKVFSDLIRISGFSHGTDVWVNNARDLILKGEVKLKEAISTRDDIMVYLQHKGLENINAFKIMEDVRKGKKLKEEYMQDMVAHKVPQWYIDSCNKISYMFPKAHATAYVIMAVRLGYFKVYHKEAFYASYFSVRGDAFAYHLFKDKETIKAALNRLKQENGNGAKEKELKNLLELAYEMHLRGVSFAPISLYESQVKKFRILEDGRLLPPFSAIPGLGEKAAESIVKERASAIFLSVDDLKRRCKVNNTLIEEMKKLGILDGLPESQQLSLFT